jgi:uncharacterized integral membrane protein (TIGR00697 family)
MSHHDAAAAQPAHSVATPDAPFRGIAPGLFALSIFYGGMVCIAGVLGNKQVALGPLSVEAGIFAFLLLVVISSAVAEVYGRALANRLVLWGFAPLVASIGLNALVLALPASAKIEAERLEAFTLMMGSTWRIWLGGIVAYGTSQLLNVTLFDRLRGAAGSGGAGVAVRSGIASALSQVVDTLIFIGIAFYGVFPIAELLVGQMIAKVVLSLALVPLLVSVAVRLARSLDARPA